MPEDKYTCCPDCATVFRVTPEQLGLRGGQVRCGHCKTVFDAVAQAVSVVPGVDADAGGRRADNAAVAAVAARETPAQEPAPQASLKPAAVSQAPVETPSRRGASIEAPSAFDASMEALSRPGASIETPSASDAPTETPSGLGASIATPSASKAPLETPSGPGESIATTSASDAPSETAPAPDGDDDTARSYDDRFSTTTGHAPKRWHAAVGAVAVMLLVLAILGQAVFHFRDAIAARWPPARPALAGLCDLAGCAIRPLRDAAMSYLSIEASDLQADPAHRGLLILTATLRNRAPWALSYPYLELTLTDAQDRVVVRRALAPGDYASGTADLPAGIGANAEVTLKVFIDASATAQAGYRLYMFYP